MSESDSKIKVGITVDKDIEQVWNFWNDTEHIVNWYFASDEWHCPSAENDLEVGKNFLYRMEAKDKSFGFDFTGKYTNIDNHKLIEYVLGDGREVKTTFEPNGDQVTVTQIFNPDKANSVDMQQQGWQAILNNFKKYVEEN